MAKRKEVKVRTERMKTAKVISGILVILGGIATWGLIGAGLIYIHVHETVHDKIIKGNDVAYHTFHHGTGGTIALAGVVAAFFTILTFGTTMLGAWMIANRNDRW